MPMTKACIKRPVRDMGATAHRHGASQAAGGLGPSMAVPAWCTGERTRMPRVRGTRAAYAL